MAAALDQDPGLLRLQQAAWRDVCQQAPPLAESISPDLAQAAVLVRPEKPTLQVRTLSAGAAITAFVPLPAGARPLTLPSWDAAAERVSQLYEITTADSAEVWVLVLRAADQSTARARLETIPTAVAGGKGLITTWAPNSPTLLVARRIESGQSQSCHRRSRLKSVNCQLVYLDTQGGGQAGLLWSPDETLVCYTAADHTSLIILQIGRGTSLSIDPSCGQDQATCFSPCSSQLSCAGSLELDKQVVGRAVLRGVIIAVRDATLVPVEIECLREVQHVAWGLARVAVASGSLEAGILVLYAASAEPSLHLLHVFDTGAYTEDLSFSPCGTFLSVLDQGSFFGIDPCGFLPLIKPESEVVIVHLPTMQARRFGSRSQTGEQLQAGMLPRLLIGRHMVASETCKFPARARLWWQGSQLLSYGPGNDKLCSPPGPHKLFDLPHSIQESFRAMPCSQLDLA